MTTSTKERPGGSAPIHQRGELRLAFERRGEKTLLGSRYFSEPFGPSWPIYPADGSGMPEVQVCIPGGGVLGGDRYEIDVSVGPGAAASVLTTGAAKVYGGPASLECASFRVEDEALLEYLPHHVIPYSGSSYRQESIFDLAPGATLLAWEAYSAGRVGRGERFAYSHLSSKTRVHRQGVPEVAEGFELPGGGEPLGGYSYTATVYLSASNEVEELAEGLHKSFAAREGILASASAPVPNLCVARVLAHDAPALYEALNECRRVIRDSRKLPPPPRRIR